MTTILKPGEFLIISQGIYEYHAETIPALVLKEFNSDIEVRAFAGKKEKKKGFLEYLEEKGLVTTRYEHVFKYVHVGDYKAGDCLK
jgi:hypothetical protein